MMALDLSDICTYGRIDADDPAAPQLTGAAEAYIVNALELKNAKTLETDPIFILCVKMLVSHWYDNRGRVSEKPVNEIPMGIQSLVSQLSNRYEAEEDI